LDEKSMRIEIVRPRDLGAAETSRWLALQASNPDAASPFLSPCWARTIDSVRPDVRVAVIEDGGKIAAFFPVQRTSSFTAMGCGAPLCDYQGVIAASDFKVSPIALARALKVGRLDFAHVPAKQRSFQPYAQEAIASHILDLSGGFDAFFERRKKEGSSTFREAAKKRRKIQRELGEIRFEAWTDDATALEQMLTWKRLQTERTGQPDIYGRQWVRDVVQKIFESKNPACRSYFMAMYAGDRHISNLLCIASQEVAHAWITSYDPALEQYSPGLVMWMDFLANAGASGFREVDFGAGDYRFKLATSNSKRLLTNGYAARVCVAGLVRGAEYKVRRTMERHAGGQWSELPGKAMRRLDVMRGLGAFSSNLK
jgi:CelD/BcsL family acetyltransferase involved in cellulose biosynthesis